MKKLILIFCLIPGLAFSKCITWNDGTSTNNGFPVENCDDDYATKKMKFEMEKAEAKKKKLEIEKRCAYEAGKASNDFAAKKIYESCMAANK